ncbi:MAG: hypothetical protein DRI74_06890 [Bacteroidetes bacterium]|nr:MAG: hypothetical protein DRI74_06890 [Bacteroidota bacterium]
MTEYNRLTAAYKEWLSALNYESKNALVGVEMIRKFTLWLWKREITEIEQIDKEHITEYFEQLRNTKSKTTGKPLSINTIKTHSRELRRFSKYLRESSQGNIEVNIKIETPPVSQNQKIIFTTQEIQKLYEACEDNLLGIRDKAMLGVYYGCGLRRTEGAMLEVSDIQFNRRMIYVRKGKNYKQRYVPMTKRVFDNMMEYNMLSRPKLTTESSGNYFFIGYRGEQLGGEQLGTRFTQLKVKADITKPGNLHSLRHSIASHLLAKGMSIEQIARFLGHDCLESTQIYTHISETLLLHSESIS